MGGIPPKWTKSRSPPIFKQKKVPSHLHYTHSPVIRECNSRGQADSLISDRMISPILLNDSLVLFREMCYFRIITCMSLFCVFFFQTGHVFSGGDSAPAARMLRRLLGGDPGPERAWKAAAAAAAHRFRLRWPGVN